MVKNRFIKILLVIAIFILSLSCNSKKFDAPFNIIQEEYAVYKTLLKDKPRKFVVLHRSPDEAFGVKREFFKERFPELQTATLDNYIERNEMFLTIDKQPFDFDYSIVNKNSENKLEKETQYYEISRVGFSKNGKQAFVHFADVCKALCEEGNHYLLKKENSEWKVINKLTSWKS